MEFLDIPIFDNDFYKMFARLTIDLIFLSLIISWLYKRRSNKSEFVFTFYMIGIIVFFLCFTLKKFELDLGMALGLFAIFGILRYRTDTIDIKEMTYLFVVIGVSVINSLANSKMSYAEIFGANLTVLLALFIIERRWVHSTQKRKVLLWNDLTYLKPEDQNVLMEELKALTGLDITHLEVGDVNYARETAKIKITYEVSSQK